MLMRIEGLIVAVGSIALAWLILRLLRLIGWEVRTVGRLHHLELRRVGDDRPEGSGINIGMGLGGIGYGSGGDVGGQGGASGSF